MLTTMNETGNHLSLRRAASMSGWRVKLQSINGWIWAMLAGAILGTSAAVGEGMGPLGDMKTEAAWVKNHLLETDEAVVAFVYGGKGSDELLRAWGRTLETKPLADGRTQHLLRWLDAETGLEVRLVAMEYGDYPAVEWTGYFKNTGKTPTPLLQELQGVDVALGLPKQPATLRTIRGDNCSAESYEPLAFKVEEKERRFAPVGGRPSNGAFPYFNVDFGGEGVMVALGWPGQWAARVSRVREVVRFQGGQELTHLKLEPGEEIRTPLVAVLFWNGDWTRGQNLWRRWMVAHNLPRPGGRLPGQLTSACMGLHQSAAGEKQFIATYLKGGVRFDYWWMDAGWYEGPEWWAAKGVGTWEPDPARFPHGIREVSDYAHRQGMKLVLWFEPERVFRGSWVWANHPEWLLKWDDAQDIRLLNLGDREARQWLTQHISRFITEQGVDLYRQDHNVDPLVPWRGQEAPERQGLTENLYVQGYLAYWDALLQQHPGMLIDSCASGGRRNDLETLRRAVPLLRSDFQAPVYNPKPPDIDSGNQGHTYGLSLWVPYYGTGVSCEDVYSVRSHLCPALGIGMNLGKPQWQVLRQRIADYRKVADYFYGDYYPLTEYSRAQNVWMAWEFVRPERGDGLIQVFRRVDSPYETARLRMRGLKANARYALTDLDTGKTREENSQDLTNGGLRVTMPIARTAALLTFREVR